MNWKRSLRSVFPPRRGALTLRDVLPLACYLLIYAATVVALEQTQTLLFTRRAAFGLMVVS
ncbi:MAG: hypothetical protein R3B91_18655, partial [Planctomycetaceae bacterium]